jgi:hypothetical protein
MLLQRHRIGKGNAGNPAAKTTGINTQQKYPRVSVVEKAGIKLPDDLLHFRPLVGIDHFYG